MKHTCLLALAAISASAQNAIPTAIPNAVPTVATAPVVVKAGTPLVIQNVGRIIPKEARVGEPVDFTTSAPLTQGDRLILAHGTTLHGHITAVKPMLQIALDPITIAGTKIVFAGSPFAVTPPKVDRQPSELNRHGQFTGKQKTEIGVALVIVVPIAVAVGVVASPFLIYEGVKHHGEIRPSHRGQVTIAADTTFDGTLLGARNSYTGLPILHVMDRWRVDNNQLYCGTDALSAKAFDQDIALRLPPGDYTFRTASAAQPPVTVHAQQSGQYMLYRDKTGLQVVDLANREDLSENLPRPDKTNFFFDYTALDKAQAAVFDEARKHGGCPTMHQLHMRPPRTPAPAPADAP